MLSSIVLPVVWIITLIPIVWSTYRWIAYRKHHVTGPIAVLLSISDIILGILMLIVWAAWATPIILTIQAL